MRTVNGAFDANDDHWRHTVDKFGRTPDIDGTDTDEEVWDGTGAYGGFLAAAASMTVSSSSANDNPASTGAWTVVVHGQDSNFREVAQTVTMAGQAGVPLPTDLIRVYRAYVDTAGTGAINAGDIWVGTGAIGVGVPAVKHAGILAGNGQTLMAIYTVPTYVGGHDVTGGYIKRFYASAGSVTSARATVALQTREFGMGWRSRRVSAIGAGAPLDETLSGGIYIGTKADIRVRVLDNGVNNTTITAGFDLKLY